MTFVNLNMPGLLAKARKEGTDAGYWLEPLPYLP